MNWIDIRIRKPTAADANKDGLVLQLSRMGNVSFYHWKSLGGVVAWMPIPEFKPVDPPEGYRLIDTANEPFRSGAKFFDYSNKVWRSARNTKYEAFLLYCAPIDEPKPKYRPFKNATEFEPYKNKWTVRIGSTEALPPQRYSSYAWSVYTWEEAFRRFMFVDDGMPFGVPEE
jgi:hypothetical protein